MTFRYPTLFICMVLSLTACAANSQDKPILNSSVNPEPSQVRKANWSKLIGTWYGSQKTKDGGTYSWIIRRNSQGIYKLEGKATNPSGAIQKIAEVGEWGAGGSIYFTIFKGWIEGNSISPSNPSDPYNRDIYKIIKLTNDEFRYQHLDNGESFVVNRVADDFQIP